MDGNKWSEEEVTKLLATRKELDISQFLWGRGMPNDPEFIEVLARVRAKEPVENEARPAECLQEMGVAGTDVKCQVFVRRLWINWLTWLIAFGRCLERLCGPPRRNSPCDDNQ